MFCNLSLKHALISPISEAGRAYKQGAYKKKYSVCIPLTDLADFLLLLFLLLLLLLFLAALPTALATSLSENPLLFTLASVLFLLLIQLATFTFVIGSLIPLRRMSIHA